MLLSTVPLNIARFDQAIAYFDEENAKDPISIEIAGALRPRELVFAERVSAWVLRLDPNASEALRLAARCQHIRRWAIPRASFPEGRTGYHQWRLRLARYHADTAAEILTQLGYEAATLEAVRKINLKQGLTSNPDCQTIEDALCLTFLELEFPDFAPKHPDTKVIEILRKTWGKMSPTGREMALQLRLPEAAQQLLTQALSPIIVPGTDTR